MLFFYCLSCICGVYTHIYITSGVWVLCLGLLVYYFFLFPHLDRTCKWKIGLGGLETDFTLITGVCAS